jgi:hypothetical protein
MAADDVILAILAMKEDEWVRERVRQGELFALGERELSEEEAEIVRQVPRRASSPTWRASRRGCIGPTATPMAI